MVCGLLRFTHNDKKRTIIAIMEQSLREPKVRGNLSVAITTPDQPLSSQDFIEEIVIKLNINIYDINYILN